MCNHETYPVKPSIWMERTLFKSAIIDPEFKNVMDNLNIVSPPPTLEKCKTEVKKHADKLSKERKARAHYTCIRDDYQDYPDFSGELRKTSELLLQTCTETEATEKGSSRRGWTPGNLSTSLGAHTCP